MIDLEALAESQKTDPVISAYDKGIVDRSMRSYFGADRYCNVGYWVPGCRELGEASRELTARLISELDCNSASILDVGCGLGATTAQVKAAFPAAEVTGINISANQIAACRNAVPDCIFLPMDAAQLEFKAGCYDSILSVEAAFHFNTREKFLNHAFRVLKSGGRLSMADIIYADGPMAQHLTVWPVMEENSLTDIEEYEWMLERCGFGDVRITDITTNTWHSWCTNIARCLPGDVEEGVISAETCQVFLNTLPALKDSVKRYIQISAFKP